MATLAELELELGRERRAASCQSRRARRLPATKPPKLNRDRQEQLRRLAATGEPVRMLAAAFGIRRATAYRYLASEQGTARQVHAGVGQGGGPSSRLTKLLQLIWSSRARNRGSSPLPR